MSDIINAAGFAAEAKSSDVFSDFAPPIREQSALRKAITAAKLRPEAECLRPLIDGAKLPDPINATIASTTRQLVEALRRKGSGSGIEALIQEYSLSSQEGIALMCLAEALLRIPDTATRDALIRDKIAAGDWKSHLGGERSLFVNAATWGLVITGKLTSTVNDSGLTASLAHLIARCGEPAIRRGIDMAMRMMGEQFVRGESIEEALRRSRSLEQRGFRYSYDMLGEAATTAADAARYYADYERAIHAIGHASAGRGIYDGPGISIKLSALHPRYSRSQADRVVHELLPKVKSLALLARRFDIGLNIDAEEADRLELSLDLLEDLCSDVELSGWNGMGFVVQAYGKRCPFVIDFIIDLARRTNRRIMVRLVKGAYWDAEVKRAQVDGLDGFPVFTRKLYTDVSYIACARKLLAATEAVFPQFATHNAQTLATIYHMAGKTHEAHQYEFQCLHGMGEPLYDEVVGPAGLDRPVRIYAPVGTHETLLAYLVRRLLENGANSSFVNRIADSTISVDELAADPAEALLAMPTFGAQHDRIIHPADLFGNRRNSIGLDLSDESTLAALSRVLIESTSIEWRAAPELARDTSRGDARPVLNPGDRHDLVGWVTDAAIDDVTDAVSASSEAMRRWGTVPPTERAASLSRAADLMQARMPVLLGLIAREAGKSLPNAVGEVREAIDFLRYYADEGRRTLGSANTPLGPIACISPWNFPLAIFTGQIAAALVTGNTVLAKPAEETPLIAAEAVRILHEAGIPRDVLQFLPGDGRVGAALIAQPLVAAVMFTGSTEVARKIQSELSKRLSPDDRPIPLIAETGGQNAMIVDSSALAEQVVGDVIASAFDSAGQRCSALRVLCLQSDVADRILTMLKGAMHELRMGRTDRLSVDIGPVISEEARANIQKHIETMVRLGHKVEQIGETDGDLEGTFVPPTIIEINSLADLKREVFGPVLHVLRHRREHLDGLIDQINATGYGLTFGLHTRLDATIDRVTERIRAGNIYVNRNTIGAVVGTQPFGGRGLSGTGPKAGGPLYLGRLVTSAPAALGRQPKGPDNVLGDLVDWLSARGLASAAKAAREHGQASALGHKVELAGPVGERNIYALHPRGCILLMPQTKDGLYHQLGAVIATGNHAVIDNACGLQAALSALPASVAARISWSNDWLTDDQLTGALIEGDAERVRAMQQRIAAIPGPLLLVQAASTDRLLRDRTAYTLDWLLQEISTSINTAAAGGNASLMTIG